MNSCPIGSGLNAAVVSGCELLPVLGLLADADAEDADAEDEDAENTRPNGEDDDADADAEESETKEAIIQSIQADDSLETLDSKREIRRCSGQST